ncbi:MAG: Uma2 family endonuclease [Thermomicrobiales bacterium]
MAVAQRMSEHAYQEFVLSGVEGAWELHDGRLVEKPGMSWEHGGFTTFLAHLLLLQLDRREFWVAVNDWRTRQSPATIYIPDIAVAPVAYGEPFRNRPCTLAIFSDPLPLVVEVWSRSTGDYDVDAKLLVYQQRGDLEIWRIHPYERTLTSWVRQPDGSYQETIYQGGIVSLAALPGVTIGLDELFDG